jgi:hypothetical protein
MMTTTYIKERLLVAFALIAGFASAQVTPPTEAKTVSVEYSHEGEALVGHLSIPQDGEGPYPGTKLPLLALWPVLLLAHVTFPSFNTLLLSNVYLF